MQLEWDINPEIIRIFDLVSIRYYSLLFMTGLALGFVVVKRLWIKEGLSMTDFERLALFVFVATVLGARLGHCLFYEPSYYLQHPLEMLLPFKIQDGNFSFTGYQGLASHGGIFAVFLAIFLFCRKREINFYAVLDKVSIGGALAAIFIRLGNFMNSEIIGKATNANYGVVFKKVDEVLRHPSQLYESFAYFMIFCIIFAVYKRKGNKQDGFVFGLFFSLLFVARFLIEFTKINQVDFEAGMVINMGQMLSIPFIILGFIIMFIKRETKVV